MLLRTHRHSLNFLIILVQANRIDISCLTVHKIRIRDNTHIIFAYFVLIFLLSNSIEAYFCLFSLFDINKIKMDELRQTVLSEVQIVASKSRFGLFSQPPPLAIGDDSPTRSLQARKGDDGKPITKPRNILAGSNRSGVDKKSYIDPPQSIHAGDLYLDPEKVDRKYYQQFHTRSTMHEKEFVPASGRDSMAKTPYHHIDENPTPKKKPARDPSGRVITSARNPTTNPMHRIHSDYFKDPKHVPDPFERKEMLQSRERAESRKRMPKEMPRTMSHGDILFSSNKIIYGYDDKAQEIMRTSRSPFVMSAPRKFHHETKFKLARRGHGEPIGKYPEFIMPTNAKEQLVIRVKRGKSEKQDWRPNSRGTFSRPTPSISYSSFNLRRML